LQAETNVNKDHRRERVRPAWHVICWIVGILSIRLTLDLAQRLLDGDRIAGLADVGVPFLFLTIAGIVEVVQSPSSKRALLVRSSPMLPAGAVLLFGGWLFYKDHLLYPAAVHHWVDVSPTGAKFTVQMPIQPTERPGTQRASGAEADERVFLVQRNNEIYTIFTAAYKPGTLDRSMLNSMEMNYAMSVGTVPQFEHDASLSDVPGKEFQLDDTKHNTSTLYRIAYLGDTAYALGYTTTIHRINIANSSAYFNSFKLLVH